MDFCPDNSIECLLRAIVNRTTEANQENRWDILTFGFTVPVGIIAGVFGLISAVQGLWNARKIRLKTREPAIGEYSKHTKSDWSIRHFRRSTKVYTPYINIPSLKNAQLDDAGIAWVKYESDYLKLLGEPLNEKSPLRNGPSAGPISGTDQSSSPSRWRISTPNVKQSSANAIAKQPSQSPTCDAEKVVPGTLEEPIFTPRKPAKLNRFAAGWVNLLAEIPASKHHFHHDEQAVQSINWNSSTLDQADYSRSGWKKRMEEREQGGKMLLQFNYEFTPGDFFAVPTWGTVESIVTLAVMAGCDEISPPSDGSELPLVEGNNMQLYFRDHPQLGTTAIFRKLPGQITYVRNPPIPDGFRDLLMSFPRKLEIRQYALEGLRPELKALFMGAVTWPRAYPFAAGKTFENAQQLCSRSEVWKSLDFVVIMTALVLDATVASRDPRPITDIAVWWSVPSKYLHHSRDYEDYEASLNYLKNAPYDGDRNLGVAGQHEQREESKNDSSETWGFPWWNLDGVALKHHLRPDHSSIRLPVFHDQLIESLARVNEHLANSTKEVEERSKFSLANAEILEESSITGDFFLLITPFALTFCLEFLRDVKAFSKLRFELKGRVRGALRHQLHELDVFLNGLYKGSKYGQHHRNFRDDLSSTIYYMSNECQPDDIRPVNAKKSIRSKQMEELLAQNEAKELRPFQNVLLYRAVVMAAFLSTAADTSLVAGTALGKRVVYML